MSMSKALTGTRDWLHDVSKITWGSPNVALNNNNCFLSHDHVIQHVTGQMCITIDDGGVEATVPENYYVKELYTMTVGIWRRTGRQAEDRLGQQMYTPEDIYSSYAKTLEQMERGIVTALHMNYPMLQWVNDYYGLRKAAAGDWFLHPWCYKGRGENITVPLDNEDSFLGRILRFEGFLRIQQVEEAL